ncbi:MAG: hypothetical protein J5585_06890 [Clostridia bacterium]|nr:hypothetical protein [Clostridia bacterium]
MTMLGIGFLYSKQYKKTINDIISGKYGKRRQELFNNTPLATVNAEQALFVCESCGAWKQDVDLTLYAPNNPKKLLKSKSLKKAVEEQGYVLFVIGWELKENYHIIMEHYCFCPKCKKRMKKSSQDDTKVLKCPICGTDNDPLDSFCWD